MRQLVCEGQCNGGAVQEFDRKIKAAGRVRFGNDIHDKESSAAPRAVLDMAKRFVYTPHTESVSIGWGGVATCSQCGTTRRWR